MGSQRKDIRYCNSVRLEQVGFGKAQHMLLDGTCGNTFSTCAQGDHVRDLLATDEFRMFVTKICVCPKVKCWRQWLCLRKNAFSGCVQVNPHGRSNTFSQHLPWRAVLPDPAPYGHSG